MGELFNAIYGGRRDEALSLIRSGRGLNAANEYGTTPLYAAAVQGEAEIVRCLLEHGADPNAESFGETEGTPLCAAAAWGYTDTVRALLEHGADPNRHERQLGDVAMTALDWARRNDHAETVTTLIEHGAA
jgi:ankyrin repeat protein